MLLLCSVNLPRAKRELSRLNQQRAPLLKLLCLRRVALTAIQSPRRTGTSPELKGRVIPDGLLPPSDLCLQSAWRPCVLMTCCQSSSTC